jgi:CRISPR-associated protein Csb2
MNMNQYLCIATTFLADRYHGKEWPPSPARLFQALLAGARTGSYREHWQTMKPVLEALERLPAPEVLASSFRQLQLYRIAVPNNDSDKAAREWSAGRSFDAASLRTLKTVSPRESSYSSGKPHVFYLWKMDDAKLLIEDLRRLASFLHTFGWGIDMAYADSFLLNEKEKQGLAGSQGYSHHVPARIGQLRDVPSPGYLQDLTDAYQRYCNRYSGDGVDPATRAIKYGQERYQRVGSIELPTAKFVLRKLENSNTPYSVPWALGMKTAAWLRHAAAEALRQEGYSDDLVNTYVLGHGNGHDRHMSFVPVPNIGTIYPDGAIRRIMLVEPADSDGKITELLQLKLSSSALHGLVENTNGARKTEPVCLLLEAQGNDVWRYYTASSRVWHSVTPVVLHGHNSEHGKFSSKKTEQLLYQAFEKVGYSRESIEELRFQPAPLWAGTAGSLQMRVPEHLKKWPRYHVAITLRNPVIGPVLAGIGKHYGIGLFAAPPDRAHREANAQKS